MSEIKSTTDYMCFKQITSNREVDQRHVKKLIAAIQENNMLHLNPIIVNDQMEVVDGQHRLEAAEQLKLPVYYVIDGKINKEHISKLNSVKKDWSVMDYINYFSIEKKPGFDKLSSFMNQHPLISPSTALMMLSAGGNRDVRALKNGVVDVSNYNRALEIAEILKFYRNLIDFAYDRNFILAVIASCQTPEYDHSIMQQKLEFQSRSLVKCINKKQYLELLEEIYNYRSSKNRLKFL